MSVKRLANVVYFGHLSVYFLIGQPLSESARGQFSRRLFLAAIPLAFRVAAYGQICHRLLLAGSRL